jgi:nocardicin N-oxygenase
MAGTRRKPYLYSHGDPHGLDPDPLYAMLRPTEPFARVQLPYGREAWLATRYDTVKSVLGDPRFSRARAANGDAPRSTPIWPRADAMVSLDPPEHTRLRRLVTAAFTVRRVERLRGRAEEVVEGLLDNLVEHGSPVDLVQQFAVSLPITMICEILGVPFADRGLFQSWSVAQLSTTAYTQDEIHEGHQQLRAYLATLVARRREQPSDDLLSALVLARDNGDQLSEDELVTQGVMLLSAGYETTANQLANFAYALLTHPKQLAWLREDLSRMPTAVEELLRFVPLATGAPSSQGHARVATTDVEIEGVPVCAGEAVLPAVNSANRDERVFTNPDELDLSRVDNPHVAFGYGPHRCLGAHLARMELQVALAGLLGRFPELRLAVQADQVEWKKGMLVRGPKELPITW